MSSDCEGPGAANSKPKVMLSAFLMLRRLAAAVRVALREEDFGILVEIARRLGTGFIAARAELDAANGMAEAAPGSRDVS